MVEGELRAEALIKIKKIIDDNKNETRFEILRRTKNIEFMREYGLNIEDIKNIVRNLSVEECFAGPEINKTEGFGGWVYKFCPIFEGVKLYIKINIITRNEAICISVHEFGKYDGVN